MSTTPTTVRIPEEIKREVERAAKEQSRAPHWVLVQILRQWLAWRKGQKK